MHQILHILKKDIYHLRIEIAVMFGAAIAYTFLHRMPSRPPFSLSGVVLAWALVIFAGTHMIARVVHAEPIPGTDQFWTSRPYRWWSLLSAKLLFIFLFVNLPVFVAQLLVFARDGFPILPHLGSFLSGLVLAILLFSLPIAAFAAMTPGILQFILSGILLIGIAWSVLTTFRLEGDWIPEISWVRYSLLMLPVVVVAIWALFNQYRSRGTFLSRAISVAVVAGALTLGLKAPRDWGFSIQSALSKEAFDSTAFRVDLQPGLPPPWEGEPGPNLRNINLPFTFRNVPDALNATIEWMEVALVGAGGQSWESPEYGRYMPFLTEVEGFPKMFSIPQPILSAMQSGPVTMRGRIFFTVFGNEQRYRWAISRNPGNVTRGLSCRLEDYEPFAALPNRSVNCRAPWFWPEHLLLVRFEDELSDPMTSSFGAPFASPLLANLWWDRSVIDTVDLVDGQWVQRYDLAEGKEMTFIFKEPLAYLSRDFEMTINLNDYIVEPSN